ncbi:MAG: HAMP domain-containing histidine kinase, partial [bacterium]|nr:HAMP domain-containing histidine kinase [bacterium]
EGEQIFEARFLPLHGRQVDIILRNITENKRLMTIAETMNLMENLGYIFSGIRHEIGNPINAIKMTVSVLKNNLDGFSRERVMEYMDRVLSEINRVEYLLKNLKSFNMFEELNMMDIRLPEFMDKFLGLVRNDFERKGAKIEYYMHPDVETACGDARALHQVLLNILSNAADALAGIENPLISISVVKVGESVRVTVSDNGPGIPEVHRNDVFKPFFTTKSTGTGLGLNIVQKIITRMGGTVKIAGRRDLGTAVVITIPGGGRDCG